jgi:hypothetical protein
LLGKEVKMPHVFLIRLPSAAAHRRAIMAWLEVREARHGFPDRRMLVSREHIDVLKRAGIPFEYLSEPPNENGKTKPARRKRRTEKTAKTSPVSS